jgi:GNAT superfamily N-acetyltransferase
VTIRALRSEDRERVARAVQQLGRQSIYFRLFSYRDELTETGLDRIMTFDADRDAALLVTTTVAGEEIVIGSGRYVRSDPTTAELAFLVAEDYYGRGIASRLLPRTNPPNIMFGFWSTDRTSAALFVESIPGRSRNSHRAACSRSNRRANVPALSSRAVVFEIKWRKRATQARH